MNIDRDLDIIEELRLLAELAEHSEVGLVMLSGRSFSDAADEIERLRDQHDRSEQSPNVTRNAPVPTFQNDRSDEEEA